MHIPLFRLALGKHQPIGALRLLRRTFLNQGSFDEKSQLRATAFRFAAPSAYKKAAGIASKQCLSWEILGTQATVERKDFDAQGSLWLAIL